MTATRIIDDHLELANIGTNTHAQIDTHIAAANDYVKRDGSLALTSDWDIGDTRKIKADEIRARDGDGLKLYDDGGNGIFVKDGGDVGISTTTPEFPLEIDTGSLASAVRIKATDGGGAYITSSYAGMVHFSGGTYYNGTNWIAASASVGRMAITGSGLGIYTNTGLTPGNSYTPTARLFIVPWSGKIGVATISPTALFDINSDILRLRTAKTPATAGAAGNTGDIGADANYIYRCVSTNSWKRAALSVW